MTQSRYGQAFRRGWFVSTVGEAAGMFWRNLATWGHEAVADGLITEPDRAALLDHLRGRVDDETRGVFSWTHHQTVLRRI